MSEERGLVEVPENAMRDDPLAFGLTAPQLGLAGAATAVAFILNLLPIWLPLRLTLAVLVAAPIFGVAVISIRGEPGYRWLMRFARFARRGGGGINDIVVQQLALLVEADNLAPGAEARVDGQHVFASQRRG